VKNRKKIPAILNQSFFFNFRCEIFYIGYIYIYILRKAIHGIFFINGTLFTTRKCMCTGTKTFTDISVMCVRIYIYTYIHTYIYIYYIYLYIYVYICQYQRKIKQEDNGHDKHST
jgi:hypothetical protein